MKRLLQTVLSAGSSRAVAPLVIGCFFIIYIVIAFFTDETLIMLMAFTRKSLILAALLALIPLNSMLRLVLETARHLKIRRLLTGKSAADLPELFDESVELSATPSFPELERRLAAVGYKTRCSENRLTAWRGIGIFPARILFIAGTLCLFAGILISITSRTVNRQMVIEGEPLPTPAGPGGKVERIILANSSSSILNKTLTMEVAPSGSGLGKRSFGIYPPSLYSGYFVYPRYLGLGLYLRFWAPDIQAGFETHCALNSYPPGKEDEVIIQGSPYRIVFNLPEPDSGNDRYISYMADRKILQFKVLKGKELLFTGRVPTGGEFVNGGYRLAIPDIRRLVVTDFIRDYGVLFIWGAALFFSAAICFWLPIRLFFPRREMLFRHESGATKACSRTEGRARRHVGVFHEALDLIDAHKAANTD